MRSIRALFVVALTSTTLPAQTIDDGFLMSKRALATGVLYSRDSWDEYWEGSRKRENQRCLAIRAMRDEAAISRLYGGIHYRSEIESGKAHGLRIGAYTLQFAQQDGAN
jgi:hypothetical protein